MQHLPSYLGFSYLGRGISLHGYSSNAQPLLLTLDEGYLLTAAVPDLQRGIAPLGPNALVSDDDKNLINSQPNHTRTTALSNSMKLSHARGATQDDKGGNIKWEQYNFFNRWCWENMQENQTGLLFHTVYKNKFKME